MSSESVPIDVQLVQQITNPSDGSRTFFGSVTDVAVDLEGRIFVLDGISSRVTTFNGDGVPIASFGGAGGGPGEFIEAGRLVVGDASDVLVADIAASRITRFRYDGTLLNTYRFSSAQVLLRDIKGVADEHLLATFIRGGLGALVDVSEALPSVEYGWLDLQDELQAPRSIASQPPPSDGSGLVWFKPRPLWAVGRDGRYVIGTSADSSIRVRHHDAGDAAGEVQIDLGSPHPVTVSEDAALRHAFARALEVAQLPPSDVREMVRDMVVGEYHPQFTAVMFGPSESLWLRLPVRGDALVGGGEPIELTDDLGAAGLKWAVYDSSGDFAGEVRFPRGFQPTAYRNHLIYGIHTGELDVQTVQIFRLRCVTSCL